MAADMGHFVDRHQTELIQHVTPVPPILDDLRDWNLIKREQNSIVRSKTTDQEKMRQLFDYVEAWGDEDKDRLLESLRKHNAPLIRRLGRHQNQMGAGMDLR
ncbi:apoptosis-associated speck-like protein containing a CARD [Dendropsophus ebraccatus]|uniref:apoptosis-associated speck-like protein containing a CARD n=1 Tax=Dendropsophus ebraccatus TaxID=150705 RepID=UPI003831C18B